MRITSRLAFLALIGAGTAALAQQQPQPMERPHGRPTTLPAFQAKMRDKMMRMDTNHDGRISQQEYQAGMVTRGSGRDPSRAFGRMDANHDGFIDQREMDASSAQRFQRRDANRDGVLTPDERHGNRGASAPRR